VGQVIAVPAAEGHQEGLADHVSAGRARAAGQRNGGYRWHAVEDRGERPRIGPGTRDQRRVVGPRPAIRRRTVAAERGGLVSCRTLSSATVK